jgi:hypothetical protein
MAYSRVNYRAPLRVGRDRRRGRPEMRTAVDAGVPHVPLARTLLIDRQLFWQRAPICAELYGNVTHSVVVAVADEIVHTSA